MQSECDSLLPLCQQHKTKSSAVTLELRKWPMQCLFTAWDHDKVRVKSSKCSKKKKHETCFPLLWIVLGLQEVLFVLQPVILLFLWCLQKSLHLSVSSYVRLRVDTKVQPAHQKSWQLPSFWEASVSVKWRSQSFSKDWCPYFGFLQQFWLDRKLEYYNCHRTWGSKTPL